MISSKTQPSVSVWLTEFIRMGRHPKVTLSVGSFGAGQSGSRLAFHFYTHLKCLLGPPELLHPFGNYSLPSEANGMFALELSKAQSCVHSGVQMAVGRLARGEGPAVWCIS